MHLQPSLLFLFTTATVILPSTIADDSISCTGYQTNPSDIAACADQLTARGTEACSVTGGGTTTFCEYGSARIVGAGTELPPGRFTTSSCVDIAIAVGHILDHCTHNLVPYGLRASGETRANNNDLIEVHAELKQ